MIWHPLTWAFWVAAVTGTLLYVSAAGRAMDIILNWSPTRADMDQLRREHHAETAAMLGHWSLGCLTVAAMLGLAGISVVWHRIVPGAMCGTGVLQAMGTTGSRAMILWGLVIAILYGWRVLDSLDSQHPEGLMVQTAARVMVTTSPFLALALFYTWNALMRIENVPPVSCCAVVYDQVLSGTGGTLDIKKFSSILLFGNLAAGAVLMGLAVLKDRFPDRGSGVMLVAVAIIWAIGAATAVKQVWAAYYYQVLSHPCPWCLFLPDYFGAGFIIFGCMAVVVLESVALWLAARTRSHHPTLADPATQQIHRSAWRIVISIIGFTLLTVGPAITWRLRTGVWIDGAP